MINVTLKHLRGFVAVAEEGSYSRAAQRLFLTQSSVTATIQQVEQAIGLTLLDRTTRRVALTNEGSEFLPVARRLLKDFDAAVSDIRAVAERQRGHLGIAAAPSVVALILPPLICEFSARYANISLAIRDAGSQSVQQRVLDSEIDFGIASKWADDPRLDFEPLLRDRFEIVVRRDHPFAKCSALTWKHLEKHRFVGLANDTGVQAMLRSVPTLPRSVQEPQYQTSSTSALEAMLKEGLGVSVLPALAARLISSKHLAFIELREPLVERELCVITRQGRSLSPAAQTILRLLHDKVNSLELPAGVRLVARMPPDPIEGKSVRRSLPKVTATTR